MTEQFLVVSAGPGEVMRARGWAKEQVAGFAWPTRWRPDDAAVALVVSELVTNALRHAGGLVGLSLVFDARRLRIMVSDDSRVRPTPRPRAAGGWGLLIVERLTEAWGVVPSPGGKRVWADLAAADATTVPAPVPAGHRHAGAPAARQDCLSCSAVITGNSGSAPVRSRRWWTVGLGASRRTLPPGPGRSGGPGPAH